MKKGQCEVLDTYNDFSVYWADARFKSLKEKVRLWQASYMKKQPELLAKQVENYKEMGIDWHEIAEKIFPQIPYRLQLMQEARDNILGVCGQIFAEASEKLGLDFDIVFVIYVGIGCGAGWATMYDGQPAVLLGLENIAEEKWQTKSKLKGLISHEVGHLVHMKWRSEWETFEKNEEDPLFRLYSEGFAGKCEHLILGKETWHMAKGKKWFSWCQQHESWLAKEFLERLKRGSVKDFFGSWFDIQGKSQTGYFLGHEFIRELEKSYNLKEIALFNIEKVKKLFEQYLVSLADRTAK